MAPRQYGRPDLPHARLSAVRFVTPAAQSQAVAGRILKVELGVKADTRPTPGPGVLFSPDIYDRFDKGHHERTSP
ncbi:hypothetical protein AU490_14565 [Lonsdalea populi]|nr:hypothetical protein AU486_13075 [Lonsdalea quercina]RAT25998.1 hypothetical protein AU490_14565 [Lonsdalea populi]RAT45746.1 hypothetical protein AU496_08990 [Lonsdalea populi]RAT51237.1 hypothetical protein AU498_11205 [Lonsdalea populi]RAT52041.1 hypothetical protein AU497_09270 [Lonsdalea populi]